MLTIIENHRKQILTGILVISLLPVFVFLQEAIVTLGQYTGTALRMYVEGVCIK